MASPPLLPSTPLPYAWCVGSRRPCSIPINGIGGVASGETSSGDLSAGATSVSVGVREPSTILAAASRVLDELEALAAEQGGVSDINELIGAFECC